MTLDDDGKPHLVYPCGWEYRVIGADEAAMRKAIGQVMGARPHLVQDGNESREKRWRSLSVTLEVQTEEERDTLHVALRDHDAVRMVI
ncbi:MAG: DUF493 domain-containing protein [Deltaproteobacteria bacterium]|nr:DUF493 domain-containing protein [Deltaproteobacteria bacterium]